MHHTYRFAEKQEAELERCRIRIRRRQGRRLGSIPRTCRSRSQVLDLRRDGLRPVHGADRYSNRRGLAQRYSGGVVGGAGGDQLDSNRLSHRRARDDSVLGILEPGAIDALAVRRFGRTVHARERAVRSRVGHRVDDRVSRDSRFRRRRNGAARIRDRLRHVLGGRSAR